ncbi:hypothetical protein PF005_g17835 [Phytophthora fragariae]|uniref:Uncharacterized protein n=1 Tax=Phytophthora fragariae TaxID=53985 RepID=A0A6A3RK00_9STRA|nr:hypothetical protein PF007_g16422 [Phytophthora fragariae]KAE9187185.1 hypothetical protein PF004_g22875 [Phytophthora fragariae]KAE9194074.1 hypothetical protein PF005_g17835 [Phytophthora fragariae]
MPAPTTQYVDVSNWSYRMWWIFLLVVHLVTGIHNVLYALFYSKLKSTYLYESLDSAGVGMPGKDHRVIAGMNATMAALHCAAVFQMTVASIWREDLVFSLWKEEKGDAYGIAKNDSTTENRSCLRGLGRLHWNVWGRRGLLGVNGNNFYPVLITREIVEKALQMIMVKRMSWYLSGTPLSWFYVLMLTLNCLTSVVTYSALRRVNEARRRFTCITCDCILNVLSCIAAPLVVALKYANEYDPEIAGFALEKWYNDEWSAHALNEFQMVVIVSRTDFACRIIFSLCVLITASNLKDLLRRFHTKTKRIACDADSVRIQENEGNLDTTAHAPSVPGAVQQTSTLVKVANSYSETGLCTHGQRFALRLIHLLFGVWGVVILALQVQASSQHELLQCVSQADSWKASKPSCTLAMIDCHELGISGNKDEVEATWGDLDRSTVTTLVIRHCPALEIPNSITDFHLITGFKIYNSTINDWGTAAAISSFHPNLVWVHLLRVNMKNVNCEAQFGIVYPIDSEDTINALQ